MTDENDSPSPREIQLKESNASPRVKPAPTEKGIGVPFIYNPSDDGTDENLLILLHGLGDTHIPFGKLGQQLRLPQTATLALRAPQQIPYLYEDAYQWFPSFDDLGEPIAHPNPSAGVSTVTTALTHLMQDCQWKPSRIHLFGFAQGGSVALESAIAHWKARPRSDCTDEGMTEERAYALASVLSVGGPLLAHHAIGAPCGTSVLLIHRPPPSALSLRPGDGTTMRRVFGTVKEVQLEAGESMPASREEWAPLMEFWSERLVKRPIDGLYEVISGIST